MSGNETVVQSIVGYHRRRTRDLHKNSETGRTKRKTVAKTLPTNFNEPRSLFELKYRFDQTISSLYVVVLRTYNTNWKT